MTLPRTTDNIRNIALVGQAGAGKTSLVEALLARAGAKSAPGRIDKGNTVTDFDPIEQRYQHSLNVAIAGCDYQGRHLNLIDTPGYPDFLAQTLSALSAAETMAVVVNAQAGIEPMTRRLMDWAAAQHMPCMVIINKIDAAPDMLESLLEEITETFGRQCLPLDLPADHAAGVVDVVGHTEGIADFADVASAHTALVEQAVESDEAALERYIEEGDVDRAGLHEPFEKALREGHLIPVCFASAETGAGVAELLDIFAELAPSPLEANPHPFLRHEEGHSREIWAEPGSDGPLLGHVFKVEFDPFIGKMGFVRIHQGRLARGSQLLVGREGKTVKVAHLLSVHGKEHNEIEAVVAGDICALGKIDELYQDAVLHEEHGQDAIVTGLHYPTPLAGLALKAKRRGDAQKIAEVLHKLVAEDPGLRIEHDMDANETVLRGLGDLQLRVALEKLDERFHVAVETHLPSIPYRETITRSAEATYRHKKQTGGAGQFGEVALSVEPLPQGTGFEFVNKVTGGAIPSQFIPAVEKGVRQALAGGALAGYPLQDLQVTVLDGKHHPVDSKEVAFVAAGRRAFLSAVDQAGPVVLEPMVNLEVSAPAASAGGISGDLASRRARINGTDTGPNGEVVIRAQAPLGELQDYGSRLKSLTGGQGTWSIEFSHYEAAPPRLQQELAARHKRAADD